MSVAAVGNAYEESFFGEYTGVADAWGDGKFAVDDITAPVGAGLDLLGLFLDPVNWIVGNLLEPIYNWLFENVKPLKDAVERVTGSPDRVRAAGDTYQRAAQGVADQANALVEHANAMFSQWQGAARDQFHRAVELVVRSQTQMTEALHKIAELAYAAAMIVSAVKEIVLTLIKELITEALTKAALVALAAIPTLGAAVAAYMSWAAAKFAVVMGKVALAFSKLLKKAAQLFGKGNRLGKLLEGLGRKMDGFADKAFDTARNAEKMRAGAETHRTQGDHQYAAAKRSHESAKRWIHDDDGNRIPGRTSMDQVYDQIRGNHQKRSGRGEYHQAQEEHLKVKEYVEEAPVSKPKEVVDRTKLVVEESYKATEDHRERRQEAGIDHNPADDIQPLDD